MAENLIREDGGKVIKEDTTYFVRQIFDDVYAAFVASLPNLGIAGGAFQGKPKWLHSRRMK